MDKFTGVLFLLLILALSWTIGSAFSTPEVLISTSSGKCIGVIPESAGTCTKRPEKYTILWTR